MDRLTHENISIRKELAEQSTKAAELRIENGNLQGRITQLSMPYEKEIEETKKQKLHMSRLQMESQYKLEKQIEVHGDINLMNQEHE